MMKALMKLQIFLIFIILTKVVFATPPKFVYRVDTRSYVEIFKNGFRAWGNNYNIVAHVNGATCSTQQGATSGFISTAADLASAQAIANEHLRQGRNTYLYTIRADNTFYSGPASIDYLQQYNPLSPLSLMSLEMARRADEWDAIDMIPPENIREAMEYRIDGSQRSYSNARYLSVDTTGNPDTYRANLEEVLRLYNFPVQLPNGVAARLSSCFSSCLGSAQSSRTSICTDEPESIIDFTAAIIGLN